MVPPESQIGPITDEARATNLTNSPIGTRYDDVIDRESAYELLAQRATSNARLLEEQERAKTQAKQRDKEREKERQARERQAKRKQPRSRRQSVGEAFLKSAVRSVGRSLGSKLVRGLLGPLLK